MMYGNTGSLLLLSGDDKNVVALFMIRFDQEYVQYRNNLIEIKVIRIMSRALDYFSLLIEH